MGVIFVKDKSSSRVTAAHLKRYDPVRQAKTETEAEASDGLSAPPTERGEWFRRIIGLVAGLIAAARIYFSMPADLEVWPKLTTATAVLTAIWRIIEAIPI